MATKLSRKTDTTKSKQTSVTSPSKWQKEQGHEAYRDLSRSINTATSTGGALSANDIAIGQSHVAGLDPMTTQGIADVGAHAFDYLPEYAKAKGMFDPSKYDLTHQQINFGDGMTRHIDPTTGKEVIDFGAFTPENLRHFQNPYDAMVREAGLADINRQQAIARRNDGLKIAAAGAFGGRGEVTRALTNDLYDRNRINFDNSALAAGYDKATAAREAERQAALSGLGLENSHNNAVDNTRLNVGKANQDLGTAEQTAGIRGGTAKITAGGIITDNKQKALDAAATFGTAGNAERDAQLRLAQLAAVNQVPSDQFSTQTGKTTSVSTQPVAAPDRTGQLIGLVSSGLGAAASLGPLLSDERTKTDKSEMDPAEEKALGAFQNVPVNTFKYKKGVQKKMGMPKGKRIGPMAQDWQGAFGGNGSTIDVGNMMGALTQAVKELDNRTSHLRGKNG